MKRVFLIALKWIPYTAVFLVSSFFSYGLFGTGEENGYRVLKDVPSAHADVPYSQASYYSEGGYGGKDGGGGGNFGDGDCDGGDDSDGCGP